MKVDCSGRWYKFSLTSPEFMDYFNKFNNTFKKKEKTYQKIDYDVWTDLKNHYTNHNITVEIRYDYYTRDMFVCAGKKVCNEIMQCGTSISDHRFSGRDGAFGTYLYDTFIKKEVETMNYNAKLATKADYMQAADKAYSSVEAAKVTGKHGGAYEVFAGDGLSASSADLAAKVATDYTYSTTIADSISSNGAYISSNGTWDKVVTHNDLNSISDTVSWLNVELETRPNFDDINRKISEHELKYHNDNKENEKMKFANFDFGPCTSDAVRMSMYGLAVKNASGTWVSYDTNSNSIMDVDIFNFDGAKFLYKIPVAIKDVKGGDIVIHGRKPMFVTKVNDATLIVIDPVDGELKEIMLTKSPFGFNFVTKVVNFMDGVMNSGNTPSESNPFGNMWMFMLLGDNKVDDLLPLMMMSNSGNMNPMMMYMLMGDNKNTKDLLPLMLFSQMNCGCGTQAN